MKYVMMKTAAGQYLPIIFPEAISHVVVAAFIKGAIKHELKQESEVSSAGFAALDVTILRDQVSESLGGLGPAESDEARINLGSAVSFMPDEIVKDMWTLYQQRPPKV